MAEHAATAPHSIKLSSGRYFDLAHPESAVFGIEEIAHALSQICRFTGHCREFYSVAQHSVMVSHIVPPEHALAGLLHDAPEAFVGDVAKPLKTMLPDYAEVEAAVEAVVFRRFGLPEKLHACVKVADLVMLRTEQRDLMRDDGVVWRGAEGVRPLALKLVPVGPKEARQAFLARFEELMRARTAGLERESAMTS